MTEAIECQIERFAPGFKDRILVRHSMNTRDVRRYDSNYVGGAITGGFADVFQLFARSVALLDPCATSNPGLFPGSGEAAGRG